MKVAVIGGGAAGMMAAASAAEEGARVTVWESGPVPGKKILSTGNGRCNLTNRDLRKECYRSEDPELMWQILQQFDETRTMQWFEQRGLAFTERGGYVYPRSEQASSVRDLLEETCIRDGVQFRCGTDISGIRTESGRFLISAKEGTKGTADRVILTAGGAAAPKTGSDGRGFLMAESLGHSVIPAVPALVPLISDDRICQRWHGVRAQGWITLLTDGKTAARDRGELQLTSSGVSGIPVFQVSRFACRAFLEKRKVEAVINFLPDITEEIFIKKMLQQSQYSENISIYRLLHGWFPDRLCDTLMKRAGISEQTPAVDAVIRKTASLCCHFPLKLSGSAGFEKAQTTAGGVPLREVDPTTLESRRVPGLFFAGEILDADGICGGYNLQWAWSSGRTAGRAAGRKNYDTDQ